MAYLSLYRKYRSQRFEELLGQDHITAVLRNSLAQNRIAHAYLFCGPRGCGKTTTARLLARALNCQSSDRPTPDPCGTCSMCVRIREGQAIDVVEMDAASETGIDDVREKIIENARYAPAEARYKVYIVDEVHDLSQKAFDSLLKTIEEPPAHVVFVLATTEAHKVPVTIRSRCQRMDFRRGGIPDIQANLRRVADAEGLQYDDDALLLIARAAEGSFRDSLSLLEQVIAVADGRITAQVVRQAIGAVTSDMLDAVLRAVHASDMRKVHEAAAALLASGADARQILVALQEHIRDLVVLHYSKSTDGLGGVSPERAKVLREQSSWFAPHRLLQMLEVLSDAERDLRFTNLHRLVVERALWQLAATGETQSQPASKHEPAAEQLPKESRDTASEPPARTGAPSAAIQTERVSESADAGPQVCATPAKETRRTEPSPEPPVSNESHVEAPSPAAKEPSPTSAADVTLEVLQRLWPRVRNNIVQRFRSAASVVTDDVRVVALEGTTVVLEFPTAFQRDRAARPEARKRIEEALEKELQLPGYTIRCVTAEELSAKPEPAPERSASDVTSPRPRRLLDLAAEELEAETIEEERR